MPFEPKLLEYPFSKDHLSRYDLISGPSLELSHLWELHAEPDLGVTIPIVDPSQMQGLPAKDRPPLHPTDQEITSEKYSRKQGVRSIGDAEQPQVDWIMSSSFFHGNVESGTPSATGRSSRVEPRLQELTSRLTGGRSKRQRVEDSFAAVQPSRLRHPDPKKRTMRPKRSWSVLPDIESFADKHVHLYVSDTGLVEDAPDPAAKRRRLSRGLVRTRDPSHGQPPRPTGAGRLSWLWVPTRTRDGDQKDSRKGGEEMEREREFELTLRRPGGSDEILALHWDATRDEISFTPVAARGDLIKVATSPAEAAASTTRMLVRRRDWTSHETALREGERAEVVSDNPTDVLERLQAASEAQHAMQPRSTQPEAPAGAEEAEGTEAEHFRESNGESESEWRQRGERGDVPPNRYPEDASRGGSAAAPAAQRGDLDVDNLFDEEDDDDDAN